MSRDVKCHRSSLLEWGPESWTSPVTSGAIQGRILRRACTWCLMLCDCCLETFHNFIFEFVLYVKTNGTMDCSVTPTHYCLLRTSSLPPASLLAYSSRTCPVSPSMSWDHCCSSTWEEPGDGPRKGGGPKHPTASRVGHESSCFCPVLLVPQYTYWVTGQRL